jgi:hypothetical protein
MGITEDTSGETAQIFPHCTRAANGDAGSIETTQQYDTNLMDAWATRFGANDVCGCD